MKGTEWFCMIMTSPAADDGAVAAAVDLAPAATPGGMPSTFWSAGAANQGYDTPAADTQQLHAHAVSTSLLHKYQR